MRRPSRWPRSRTSSSRPRPRSPTPAPASSASGPKASPRPPVGRPRGARRGHELSRARARLATLQEKGERPASGAARLRGEAEAAEQLEGPLVERLATAEQERANAEQRVAEAEAGLRAADGDRHAW